MNNTTLRREGRWSEVASELYDTKQQLIEMGKLGAALIKELKELSQYTSSRDEHFFYEKSFRKGDINRDLLIKMEEIDIELYRKEDCEVWKLIKL